MSSVAGESLQPVAAPAGRRKSLLAGVHTLFVPSLADCLFVAVLVWHFISGAGWAILLADGDTGWHIRVGEHILAGGGIPAKDLFSFSRPGEPWFAWEWLSDVIFALLHRTYGLKGVVWLAGAVLTATTVLLFGNVLRRTANIFLALALTLLATGASTVHFLARPHVFTLLLLVIALGFLERDTRRPGRAVWVLIPLTALWTNLHGGFLVLIACLGVRTAAFAVCWQTGRNENLGADAARIQALRSLVLTVGCILASLVNPYGYSLHLHVWRYLHSDWIRRAVDEFQSPKFRSENMLQFEVLLFLGLGCVVPLLRRRRFEDVLLILFWAYAALASVRHVPIFALIAAPVVAGELDRAWELFTATKSPRSMTGILRGLIQDFRAGAHRISVWPLVTLLFVLVPGAGGKWPLDFPDRRFPAKLVSRNHEVFFKANAAGRRVFTTDQWGDYLIYRFYPRQRVFIDGRSDFYGPAIGKEYLRLLGARFGWDELMSRYGFELALVPVDEPLTELLKRHPRWRVLDDDGKAVLFERRPGKDLIPPGHSAELTYGGTAE